MKKCGSAGLCVVLQLVVHDGPGWEYRCSAASGPNMKSRIVLKMQNVSCCYSLKKQINAVCYREYPPSFC